MIEFLVEILSDSRIVSTVEVSALLKEANEILAIVAKARKTVSNK